MQYVLSDDEVEHMHLLANTDLRLIVNALCEGGKVVKGILLIAPHTVHIAMKVSTQAFFTGIWSCTRTTGPPEHSLQDTKPFNTSFSPSISRITSLFPHSVDSSSELEVTLLSGV